MGFNITYHIKNKGKGYDGDRTVSTANKQIVVPPAGVTNYKFYEFAFLNTQACTVKINGGKLIPLDADQGVKITDNDAPVSSFVIVEAGINYKWFGKY